MKIYTGARKEYVDHLKTYHQRYQQVMRQLQYDAIVIAVGKQEFYSQDDREIPYKPYPHFASWIPANTDMAGSFLSVEEDTVVLYIGVDDDFWSAPQNLNILEHLPAWIQVKSQTGGWEAKSVVSSRRTAWVGPEHTFAEASAAGAEVAPEMLLRALNYYRARKTPYEIMCIEQAQKSGAQGHKRVRDAYMQGMSTREIYYQWLDASAQTDCEQPYSCIIASGRDAAVLHYQLYKDEPLGAPGTLLVDAGTQVNGYASDITRTHVRDAQDFAEFVVLVDEMQRNLAMECKPGLDFLQFHELSHLRLAQSVVDSGLATCSAEALVEQGVMRLLMPHGIGHMLGIQVHDVGGRQNRPEDAPVAENPLYPWLRADCVLEKGMVHTVEPGLYFIDVLLAELRAGPARDSINWDLLERWHPYGGVRIEDNVLVDDEPENLTRKYLP